MARRKKQTEEATTRITTTNVIETPAEVAASAAPSEDPLAEAPPIETPAEMPAPPPEAASGDSERQQAMPPGRAWSERFIQPIKYSRSNFKDSGGKHLIAFRFDLPAGATRPSDELLAVLRSHKIFNKGKPVGLTPHAGSDPESISTGLHYEDFGPGRGKLWVMPNGELGRTVADSLDMALNNLAKKIERDSARGA